MTGKQTNKREVNSKTCPILNTQNGNESTTCIKAHPNTHTHTPTQNKRQNMTALKFADIHVNKF